MYFIQTQYIINNKQYKCMRKYKYLILIGLTCILVCIYKLIAGSHYAHTLQLPIYAQPMPIFILYLYLPFIHIHAFIILIFPLYALQFLYNIQPMGWEQSKQQQAQQQVSKQAQLVDQNYANNICFMALSTMESLQYLQTQLKLKPQSTNISVQGLDISRKQFGRYDKQDYSHKNVNQLKDQLNNNVFLLANSRMAFIKQFGEGSYKLPSAYDQNKVLQRLSAFKKRFSQLGDKEGGLLAEDMENIIMKGELNNLNCLKMQFLGGQSKSSNSQFVENGMRSTNEMHDEGDRIRNVVNATTKAEDLPFYANPSYQPNNYNSYNNYNNNNNNGKCLVFSKQAPLTEHMTKWVQQNINNIRQLGVQNCQLTQQGYQLINQVKNLHTLRLVGIQFTSQQLSPILVNSPSMRILQLVDCKINGQLLQSIAPLLPPQLAHLSLSRNQVTTEGLYDMYKAIEKDRKLQLQGLCVANNWLNPNKFADVCSRWANLKQLDISNNDRITDNEAKCIGQHMKKLQVLCIGRTKITGQGLTDISNGCSKLRVLNVCGNYLSHESVGNILNMIPNLRQLHINISVENRQKYADYLKKVQGQYSQCKIAYIN